MSTSSLRADGAPRHTSETPGAEQGLGSAASHADTPHARGNSMGKTTGWAAMAIALFVLAAIAAAVTGTSLSEVFSPEPTRGQQALPTPDVP